jgi:hypothetical protein
MVSRLARWITRWRPALHRRREAARGRSLLVIVMVGCLMAIVALDTLGRTAGVRP